tara:strand:- start:217 stop:597 length:381 start_codon:yes stop_codon:yes gene_type:complete
VPRKIYHSRGSEFNEWHRQYSGIAAVDIDLVPCCKDCYEPLCLIEHAFDKGQTHKTCSVTIKLAKRSRIPAWLIFYNVPVTKLRVQKLSPVLGELKSVSPYTFVRYLKKLQSSCSVCNGLKTIARP